MTRKEFIANSIKMGIGLPLLTSLLPSCRDEEPFFPEFSTQFSGKVIVVGAGAAGLAAGYMLKRYGIDFQILEAAPRYGGRLKKAPHFADFPIDLGAEWIHTDPRILADILSNPKAETDVEILVYNPQTIKAWNNGKLKSHNYLSNFYSEWKFKHSTWFDFFEQHIALEVAHRLVLNKPITEISYAGDQVLLTAEDSETFACDKVLITVPITVLQTERIQFSPPLPPSKTDAVNKIFMGDGIKVFVEFRERFYPDILVFGSIFQALSEEEKFVYDAAFRKDSNRNILGLFAINEKANVYTRLNSDEAIISAFLAELDQIFDGKASPNYMGHIIQNWSADPFIQGAYSYSFDGDKKSIMNAITEPLADKVYFAGEALSPENHSMVHGACESAYAVVARMLKLT